MQEIHRLRRKFILAATLAVIIILSVALGLINIIGHVRMQDEIDSHLTMISRNNGQMPRSQIPRTDSLLQDPDWYNDSPESLYQMRYFSVLMNRSGTFVSANLNHIASFGKLDVEETVRAINASGKTRGSFRKNRAHYDFLVTQPDTDHSLIVVLDTTRDLAAVEAFMLYSLRFGLFCVIIYVLILMAICNVIIRPFVENMQNQKRFITNASHELKTPIAIISANAEALELLQGKSEWTKNIITEVKRLTHLINGLISLGQIEPGIVAQTEEKSLFEIFNILMDNAVKYCDEGGTITAALTKNGRHGFRASVSNSYAQGADKDYTHYFERFYRGDESHSSDKVPGYGIGLSMAKELTELLKGSIAVSYKDGVITYTVKS